MLSMKARSMIPTLSTRGSISMTIALLAWCGSTLVFAADRATGLQLRDGDVVALCGDSITSAGYYPLFLEAYQIACGPPLKVEYVNCGRWGEVARDFPKTWDKDFLPAKPTVLTICYGMNIGRGGAVLSDDDLAREAAALTAIIEKFKANGGRTVVLGSPGCVDTTFHPKPAAANASLAQLRDNARKVATETGCTFADVHSAMLEVMSKAQAKHGKDFAFAGEKGDGLHPRGAGHLVMAWVFLKALGYDGQVGAFTVDGKTAQASAGHRVVSFADGVLEIESTRYPFCFLADPYSPKDFTNNNATRSVADLFPFNDDLNRLTLVVRDSPAEKIKITWGSQSKVFDRAALEQGINLAAEFLDNPFVEPFERLVFTLRERNSCRDWLTQEQYKNDASIPKRLEKALQDLKLQPVRHSIRIEAAQ